MTNDNQDLDNQQFDFIKEKIKKRPLDRRRLFIRIGTLVMAAVLFGVIAGLTMAAVYPWAQDKFADEEQPPKIVIPEDTEEETDPGDGAAESEPRETEPETPEETQTQTEIVEVPKDFEAKDYRKLMSQMTQTANEAMNAMVIVTGISTSSDWFDTTYDSDAAGLMVAESDKELFVLTEYRAVTGAADIRVTFPDGSTASASLQCYDMNVGLAVVKVALDDISEETRKILVTDMLYENTAAANQGEPVIAIGNPQGYVSSYLYGAVTTAGGNTFSVSQNNTSIQANTYDYDYIVLHTDMTGSMDGSGILINLEGKIVGIIAQRFTVDSSKGLVSALSVSQMKPLINRLINNESTPKMGIRGADVTEEIAESEDMPMGVFIRDLEVDSPAYEASIQKGDIIVQVGETEILTNVQYKNTLLEHAPEDVVKITVMRKSSEGYEPYEYHVTLGAMR